MDCKHILQVFVFVKDISEASTIPSAVGCSSVPLCIALRDKTVHSTLTFILHSDVFQCLNLAHFSLTHLIIKTQPQSERSIELENSLRVST